MARTREFDTDQALEHAMDLFRTHGYEGVSTRRLEQSMGIGTGSLYAAFGNKERLYLAAVERSRQQMMAITWAALSAKENVLDIVHGILSQASTPDNDHEWAPGCMLLRAAIERAGRDPAVDRLLRDALTAVQDSFTETIRRAQQRGQVRADVAAEDLARFLVTTIQGLRAMAMVDPAPEKLRATVAIAVGCLADARQPVHNNGADVSSVAAAASWAGR